MQGMLDSLLLALHGACLRALAENSGVQSERLMQAVRRAKIMNTMGKKLRQLDTVAAWVGHTTQPKCAEFLELLEKECKGQVSFV